MFSFAASLAKACFFGSFTLRKACSKNWKNELAPMGKLRWKTKKAANKMTAQWVALTANRIFFSRTRKTSYTFIPPVHNWQPWVVAMFPVSLAMSALWHTYFMILCAIICASTVCIWHCMHNVITQWMQNNSQVLVRCITSHCVL